MKVSYPHLLQPLKVGKFILKNRMQSSNSLPHFSQGPEAYPAGATIAHFLGRARTGAAFVTMAGFEDMVNHPDFPDTLDISHFPEFDLRNAQCQNYMVELVEAMHGVGSLVSGSLFSANRTYRYENEKGEVEFVDANPREMVIEGATAMMNPSVGDDVPAENLVKIAKSYGQRTALYKRLGFDAVTIHMSYRAQLPGQLLSPLSNHRTDEYGGSLENRARFALMMLQEVKKAAGDDMLIEIQFSGVEPEGGYTQEEGIEFLRLAEPYIDIVQVRSPEGDPNHPIPFELNPTPFLDLAAHVKAAGLDMLVSSVGGYFDPEQADKAIAEGKLDLVAMARAWISNPDYGDLVYEGRTEDIVPCLRCNKCHGRGKRDVLATVCSVNPKFGFEAVDRYLVTPVRERKNIAVIGGGPGGMRTALFLADRGHTVTIFEAESELGGAIRHADYVDFKWTLRDYKNYLIHQVEKKGIHVVLNTRATPEMVADRYDTVIAAVGAQPVIPRIPGADGANVTVATNALMNAGTIGKTVVIIGGGEVGVETGMFLAQQGREVTVIEMRDELAADTTFMHYRSMFQAAWEAIPSFHFILNASAKEIGPDSVTYTDGNGVDHKLPADSVVLSVGMRSKSDEALSFYGAAPRFYMVGDCKQPGTIQTTNRNAYATAMSI
ncbi:MAG: FAD-dependent oxidoreductase [Oscillospiraceae bacterium]|nr:FAD-dependent oxidoreductase [Oscillospiraceae bacterium]